MSNIVDLDKVRRQREAEVEAWEKCRQYGGVAALPYRTQALQAIINQAEQVTYVKPGEVPSPRIAQADQLLQDATRQRFTVAPDKDLGVLQLTFDDGGRYEMHFQGEFNPVTLKAYLASLESEAVDNMLVDRARLWNKDDGHYRDLSWLQSNLKTLELEGLLRCAQSCVKGDMSFDDTAAGRPPHYAEMAINDIAALARRSLFLITLSPSSHQIALRFLDQDETVVNITLPSHLSSGVLEEIELQLRHEQGVNLAFVDAADPRRALAQEKVQDAIAPDDVISTLTQALERGGYSAPQSDDETVQAAPTPGNVIPLRRR